MPLLTAFPKALSTARIWLAADSWFFVSIAWRALFIKVRSLDLVSMLRARFFKLC
jgi:hypothetical protein